MKTTGMKVCLFLSIMFFVLPTYGQERLRETKREADKAIGGFDPIPVDRPDGFYATVDYDRFANKENITLDEKPSITKEDIQSVEKGVDGRGMQIVNVTLTKNGAKKFYVLTKNNVAKPIAIVIGKYIVSMPVVFTEISGEKVSISGNFSTEEIDEIIERLKN